MADNHNKAQNKQDEQEPNESAQGAVSSEAPTTPSAKNNLNDAAKKAGEFAGKAFAMGKAATKDIAQELKNVNEIRKETVATADEGTKKTDIAKGFWAKLSGKQKSILLIIVAIAFYIAYSIIFSDHSQSNATKATKPVSKGNIQLEMNEASCKKIDGYGANDNIALGTTFNVPMSSIKFIGARWDYGKWGVKECLMIFDTAKGPKKCGIISILSDDGGKTAFASVDPFKVGQAGNCY